MIGGILDLGIKLKAENSDDMHEFDKIADDVAAYVEMACVSWGLATAEEECKPVDGEPLRLAKPGPEWTNMRGSL